MHQNNLQLDKFDTPVTAGNWSSMLPADDDDRSPFDFRFWLLNIQHKNTCDNDFIAEVIQQFSLTNIRILCSGFATLSS